MRILGIETSCDETSAAVIEYDNGRFSVLSNVVASQTKIHAKTGGVVPEVAARNHVVDILPVVEQALRQGSTKFKAQNPKTIDVIAVTVGPGLITSLLVGIETARYLAYAWKKPIVGVNHLAGHLYSSLLTSPPPSPVRRGSQKKPPLLLGEGKGEVIHFPALSLIVSGGHTELVLMKKFGHYKLIGSTRDDAAGEAFDKTAKLLGLPYPGGPHLAKLAEKGDPTAYDFPRGMIHSKDFDFSFSGLKTAVLYFIKKTSPQPSPTRRGGARYAIRDKRLADVCASIQAAIVDVLVAKTVAAAKKYRVKTVLLGGGVAANTALRSQLGSALIEVSKAISYKLPALRYTTDNAAMIAAAGAIQYELRGASNIERLHPDPHLALR